jgi:protein TonB
LPSADSPPTGNDESARITAPDYPVSARKSSAEGIVVALAHIDWTGYVCRITMTVGSGVPAIDRAALDAMRTWRLKPALAGGQPVEALYDVSMGFGIKDYKLNLDRGPSDLSPKKGTRLPSNP